MNNDQIQKWNSIDHRLMKSIAFLTNSNLITENFDYRYGLLNAKYSNENYGPMNDTIIPLSPTSSIDFETEDENDYLPSIKEVSENIIDILTIKYLDSYEELTTAPTPLPGILFIDIDKSLKAFNFKTLLNAYSKCEIEEAMIISFQSIAFGLIKFASIDMCKEAFDVLTTKTRFNIKYAYDITDIKDSMWFGVIIRNLPISDVKQIEELCNKYLKKNKQQVKYVLSPKEIKGVICTIAIMNDLESAENLCRDFKYKMVKINLHLKCCRIREDIHHSHFFNFFNFNYDTYSFI